MTYEELVSECKRLRGRHEKAEAEFFAFLMKAEREFREVWTESGCDTFDQFLRSNHICDPSRYRFFAIGADRVGLKEAIEYGAPWTIQRGRLDHAPDAAVEEFRDRARAFVETEGVAPSEQAVREWRSQAMPAAAGPHKTILKATELQRLREENVRLRAELKAANARILELEGGSKRHNKRKKVA